MRTSRRGFTLIELMAVIAIIGVLTTLTAVAAFKMIGNRQRKNTEASLDKLASVLRQRMAQVIDDARNETIPPTVLTLAGNDPNRARVIWVKLRLKQQFPMSFAEALNPAPGYLTGEPAYQRIISARTGPTNAATESAACLLMALTARVQRGSSTESDLLSALEKVDTDRDGVREIVDGWGTPINFYRWPTGNAAAMNALDPNPTATFHDVQDPNGTLNAPGGWTPASFVAVCHPITAPGGRYLVPALVSAGPDKNFGITDQWMTIGSPTAAADNVTVYVQK